MHTEKGLVPGWWVRAEEEGEGQGLSVIRRRDVSSTQLMQYHFMIGYHFDQVHVEHHLSVR